MGKERKSCSPKTTDYCMNGSLRGTTLQFRLLWSKSMLAHRAKSSWCSASTSSMPWLMRTSSVSSSTSSPSRMRKSRTSRKNSMSQIWPCHSWIFCQMVWNQKCAPSSYNPSKWNCCKRSSPISRAAWKSRFRSEWSLRFVRRWSASPLAYSTFAWRSSKTLILIIRMPAKKYKKQSPAQTRPSSIRNSSSSCSTTWSWLSMSLERK